MDLRAKHRRRSLLAKDIGAYVVHLEQTIDTLREELAGSAVRTAALVRQGYDQGHREGREYERSTRAGSAHP